MTGRNFAGVTEFTIPRIATYAVIDLGAAR
jgi:hypothetical protein